MVRCYAGKHIRERSELRVTLKPLDLMPRKEISFTLLEELLYFGEQ